MEGGEDLYDEFGNYIGPDINMEPGDESDSGSEASSSSDEGRGAVSKSKSHLCGSLL